MLSLNLNLVTWGRGERRKIELLSMSCGLTVTRIWKQPFLSVALQFLIHFQKAIVHNWLKISQKILRTHGNSFTNSFILRIQFVDNFFIQLNNVNARGYALLEIAINCQTSSSNHIHYGLVRNGPPEGGTYGPVGKVFSLQT